MTDPTTAPEQQGEPHKPETWPVDADGFMPNLCTVCGTPARYGSRHSQCAPGWKAPKVAPPSGIPQEGVQAAPPSLAELAGLGEHDKDGWCCWCGCGNDRLAYGHLTNCQRPSAAASTPQAQQAKDVGDAAEQTVSARVTRQGDRFGVELFINGLANEAMAQRACGALLQLVAGDEIKGN